MGKIFSLFVGRGMTCGTCIEIRKSCYLKEAASGSGWWMDLARRASKKGCGEGRHKKKKYFCKINDDIAMTLGVCISFA